MRKVFGLLAAAAIMIATFAACNNDKIPYKELDAAVKAANEKVQASPNPFVDSTSITYDELTNTVKFTVVLPGAVNPQAIAPEAEKMADDFVKAMVRNDEHDLCNPIINAHSNVLVSIEGRSGEPYQIEIENKTIADAKAALIEE